MLYLGFDNLSLLIGQLENSRSIELSAVPFCLGVRNVRNSLPTIFALCLLFLSACNTTNQDNTDNVSNSPAEESAQQMTFHELYCDGMVPAAEPVYLCDEFLFAGDDPKITFADWDQAQYCCLMVPRAAEFLKSTMIELGSQGRPKEMSFLDTMQQRPSAKIWQVENPFVKESLQQAIEFTLLSIRMRLNTQLNFPRICFRNFYNP